MGLLDDYMDDPVNQGLLAASTGLLSAGGPSRMPVSFGQALGQGITQGMAGYQQGQQDRRANLAFQLQQLQLQQQLRQQALLNPIYASLGAQFGGPSAAAAAAAAAGLAPAEQALGQGAQAEDVGPTVGNAARMDSMPAQAPSTAPAAGPGIGGIDPQTAGYVLALGGPGELSKSIASANAPTDFQKTLRASGIDPASPLRRQLLQAQIAKQNYVAPVNARPGSIMRDPFDPSKVLAYNPHIPDGGTPLFDGSGNVVGVTPIPGAAAVTQGMSYATNAGKNAAEPLAGFDQNGQPVFGNKLTAAGGSMPGIWTGSAPTPQNIAGLRAEAAKGNPDAIGALNAIQSSGASGFAPAPRIGTEGLVKDMQQDYTTNVAPALQQAQTTTSYLQSIKSLAANASLGSLSSQLALANGLLAAVGSERATNVQTANNLLDKYHEQIVARLGSGGMATDSARAILDGAYPGRKMNLQAVGEAADNLVGANDLVKARAQTLMPLYTSLNPQAYNQAKTVFDQNADPRIWQLRNMDAKSGEKYLSGMPPDVRSDLSRRAANLKNAGML